MPTVELSFSALPTHVRTARLIAAAVGRRTGVSEPLIDEVKLAVGEACARAVGLHQEHAPDDPVVVSFSDDGDRFVVVVRDRGPDSGEDPSLPDLTDLVTSEAAEPTGLGLAVITGLVDDVQIGSTSPGTSVYMSWPRGAARAEAAPA